MMVVKGNNKIAMQARLIEVQKANSRVSGHAAPSPEMVKRLNNLRTIETINEIRRIGEQNAEVWDE